jgi:hypothetical protein
LDGENGIEIGITYVVVEFRDAGQVIEREERGGGVERRRRGSG